MATATARGVAGDRLPWWVALILGISYVILGLFLLFQPLASLLVIVLFIGASWFVSGVVDLFSLFRSRERWIWTIISGVIGIWAGLVVLSQPLMAAVVLPTFYVILIAITGIFIGVARMVQGFQGGGWGVAIWGIATIILSGWLLFHPLSGAVALPFVGGILAIAGGIATIAAAFMSRR